MPDEPAGATTLINIPLSIPIEHVFPDELQTYFIETAVAQFLPDHFILSFFEVWPPALSGETVEQQVAALSKMPSIRAKCVSRLVVTPSKMREIIKTFTVNLENYEKALEAQGGE
jgi:hypothetical protein